MLTIYKPGQMPVRGLRTSLQGAQLQDGYFQAIDNLRWDSGVLTVRKGIGVVSDAHDADHSTPSTNCLGAWSGALNGTHYVISAWAVTSPEARTAIFTLNLSNGLFEEITSPGGSPATSWGGTSTGRTRLGSSSAEVRFSVASTPRRVVDGSIESSRDLLVIQNGVDYPLIFDPSQEGNNPKVVVHKNITPPSEATVFKTIASFGAFFQVNGNTGKSYYSDTTGTPRINTTGFVTLANSGTGSGFTGANSCIVFSLGGSTGTDPVAACGFSTAAEFFGEQLCMIVEGTAASVNEMLTRCSIDLGVQSHVYTSVTQWDNVYDPTSLEFEVSERPLSVPLDPNNTRTMLVFNIRHLPAARSYKHIRFVRKSLPAVAAAVLILGIMSAGKGQGFYYGTEFGITYSDRYSQAESGLIISSRTDMDSLLACGGPKDKDNGTSTIMLPHSTEVLYDHILEVRNPLLSSYTGGLDGIPQSLDVYFRTAEEAELNADHLYWVSVPIFKPDNPTLHTWKMQLPFWLGSGPVRRVSRFRTSVAGSLTTAMADRESRDPGVPAPSAYNIAMPRAAAVWSANGRTFAGNVIDDNNKAAPGDLYFSSRMFPFRFQSIQTSEESGSRLVFEGESIRAGAMTAAAANGASVVYVLTDQSFNALGTAGGFVGSGYDASSLATRVRINTHGTNEPSSLQEISGLIFYIDQGGQIVRFENGSVTSISRNAVENRLRAIPFDRRGKACAVFWNDRYYLAYTPTGGIDNTRLLGWNEVLREWEFEDTLPSTMTALKMVRAFDASRPGSGQRLIVFSKNRKVYAYEEGTTEPDTAVGPRIQLRTREVQTPDLRLFRFGTTQAMVDAHTATLNVDSYYKPHNSVFHGEINCADTAGKPLAIKQDSRVRTSSSGVPESGWSGFLDFSGNLAAGKVIWRIESDVEMLSRGAGER